MVEETVELELSLGAEELEELVSGTVELGALPVEVVVESPDEDVLEDPPSETVVVETGGKFPEPPGLPVPVVLPAPAPLTAPVPGSSFGVDDTVVEGLVSGSTTGVEELVLGGTEVVVVGTVEVEEDPFVSGSGEEETVLEGVSVVGVVVGTSTPVEPPPIVPSSGAVEVDEEGAGSPSGSGGGVDVGTSELDPEEETDVVLGVSPGSEEVGKSLVVVVPPP